MRWKEEGEGKGVSRGTKDKEEKQSGGRRKEEPQERLGCHAITSVVDYQQQQFIHTDCDRKGREKGKEFIREEGA